MNVFKGPDGQEDMPYLLTPGPVTTSRAVKFAMLADYGSRDGEFAKIVSHVRDELKRIAGSGEQHDCVLMQGPGTFAMEAVIGTLCPAKRKKTLVISNGTYAERAATLLERAERPFVKLAYRETSSPTAEDIEKQLREDKTISHVWLVHCETSTGMLNPLREIARVVKAQGRLLIVDAVSSFGGIPLNMVQDGIDVLIASAHKCLESVPGFTFVLLDRALITAAANESQSIALDLYAQWKAMNDFEQFRFAPPTHTVIALREALREYVSEGGIDGRSKRYRRNADVLRERLKALGFQMLLPDSDAAPVVQTVLAPKSVHFDFQRFYLALRAKGFVIAPGMLNTRQTFRIGCMGKVDETVMLQLVKAIEDVMRDMDVRSFAPADI
jgi:2-aminoethylphosphonate-pyruvate transaminase